MQAISVIIFLKWCLKLVTWSEFPVCVDAAVENNL